MKVVHKSAKLANVCYDIRGPIMDAAKQMEEDGHKIIKLNIGNLAVFGFDAPEEIQLDMIRNLPHSSGYADSKGIFAARKAVMHETQKQGLAGVTLDDIYLGNGASELIVMATNALLDAGDELLLPAPDYPLWTAPATLSPRPPLPHPSDKPRPRPRAPRPPPPGGPPPPPPRGRHAGALPVRRGPGLDAGPRRHPRQNQPPHQGHRGHQPEQPHRSAVPGVAARRPGADRAHPWPGDLRRRGLRQGAVRRRQAPGHRFIEPGCADADVQLAVQELPLLRLPRRLAGGLGRQEAGARLHRGSENALEHAAVLERARPKGGTDGPGGLSEHQRVGRRRRAPAPAARPGV